MSRLVIVGNGFDLAHGVRSSYFSFRDHLRNRHSSLYNVIVELSSEDVWFRLEENLADLDLGGLIDKLQSEHLTLTNQEKKYWNNPYDEHAARMIASTLHDVVEQLTVDLGRELHTWIEEIDKQEKKAVFECFANDDYVISFNYTSTAVDLYDFDPYRMFYIHNRARFDDSSFNFFCLDIDAMCSYLRSEVDRPYEYDRLDCNRRLIFGHGDSRFRNTPSPAIPAMTRDYDTKNAHIILSEAYRNAYEYFDKMCKKTHEIVPVLDKFLETVGSIDKVLIIGHSLSSVDLDYFKRIVDRSRSSTEFTITYYGDESQQLIQSNAGKFLGESHNVDFVDLSKANKLIKQR